MCKILRPTEAFFGILDWRNVGSFRRHCAGLIEQPLDVQLVIVEHHEAIIQPVEADLGPHVAYRHSGERIHLLVPNGNDEAVETVTFSVRSVQLGEDVCIICSLTKIGRPTFCCLLYTRFINNVRRQLFHVHYD